MPKEVLEPNEVVINFYGEKEFADVVSGLQVVSLRLPASKYDIPKGARAVAHCPDNGESVPVIILANDVLPLNEISNACLLLDRYPTVDHAVGDLSQYPGDYESIGEETSMQRIAFMPLDRWDALTESQRRSFKQNDFEVVIREPELGSVFLPVVAHWLAENGEGSNGGKVTVRDWINFVDDQSLMVEEAWQIAGTIVRIFDIGEYPLSKLFTIGDRAMLKSVLTGVQTGRKV